MNTIETYYDENSQTEWERFNRHPTEFAVTKRALAEYLPPAPAHLFNIGGGPGRYAIHLAQSGYRVTLLDLSAGNLQLARRKAAEAGVEIDCIVHGNALTLNRFEPECFDAVLLMGPLYHLAQPAERRQAVEQALATLKPGGRLFATYITLFAPFRDGLVKGYGLEFPSHPERAELLLRGVNPPNSGFTDAYFAHPDEVIPFMEATGELKTLALLGVEGVAAGNQSLLKTLTGPDWEYWVDLNYRFARDPALRGAADHLLYIGEKIQV